MGARAERLRTFLAFNISFFKYLCSIAAATTGLMFGAVAADAQTAPANTLETAPLVTPSSALTFYGASTTHTPGVGAWTTNPPEIQALARALGANRLSATQYSQNVFDYVRNNIAVEFRFGLGKGARGALIDQSGTPMDQADLMVKLLRQGGVTATYKFGTITLTSQQFGQWSGLVTNLNQAAQTFTVDAKSACQFLADGGVPATVNGATSCTSLTGNLTTVTVAHVWVSANGNLYDPSYKRSILKTGVDVAAAIGCGSASAPTCASTAKASVLQSATTGNFIAGVPYVQNLNESAVLSTMDGFAKGLQTTIASGDRTQQVNDVIGGAQPDPTYSPTVGSSLPYTSSTFLSWSGDVPDQYRTKFVVASCGTNVTFYGDEVSGRRIRLSYLGSPLSNPTDALYLDDASVSQCADQSNNPITSLALSVTHPYAASSGGYASDSMTVPVERLDLGPLMVTFQLGEATQSTQKYYADLQAQDPTPFELYSSCSVNVTPQQCRGDDQPSLAAQLAAQQSIALQVVSAISGAQVRHHHRIGAFQLEGTIGGKAGRAGHQDLDVQSAISADPAIGGVPDQTSFETASLIESMLEGSVVQQSGNTYEPISGALDLVYVNRGGVQILDVPASMMASVTPSLTDYNIIGGTTALQSLATAGYESIIPLDGAIPCPASAEYSVTISGYQLNEYNCISGNHRYGPDYEFKAGSVGLLLGETYKGGFEAVGIPNPNGDILSGIEQAEKAKAAVRAKAKVEEANGDFSLSPAPDIVTGAGTFPKSLSLVRTYSSSTNMTEAWLPPATNNTPVYYKYVYQGPDSSVPLRLGGGWVHNFQINASISSDPWIAMGQDSAIDASGFIAGVYTIRQLIIANDFDDRIGAIFADYWVSKQIFNDVVQVQEGPKSQTFRRLPDGTFNAPPGSSDILQQTGSKTYAMHGGWAPDYDYSGVAFKLTKTDGSVLSFDWSTRTFPYGWDNYLGGYDGTFEQPFIAPKFKVNSWTFPDGEKVTFNYTLISASTNLLAQGNVVPGKDEYVLSNVSNSLGRSLTFNWTEQEQRGDLSTWAFPIDSVVDDSGRQVSYALSACPALPNEIGEALSAGFLCNTFSVTLPDQSVEQYTYQAGSDSPDPALLTRPNYHLRRIFSRSDLTNPMEVVGFDPVFKVATVTDALSHAWSHYASAQFPLENWKRGEAVDPLGASTVTLYSEFGSPFQVTDPLGRVQTSSYDNARRIVTQTNVEGDCRTYSYDVRSNLLQASSYPKGSCGSPGTALSKTATYGEAPSVVTCLNPVICNKQLTITDANGNTTTNQWDPTSGNLTSQTRPADSQGQSPQTTLAYSSFGAPGAQFALLTSETKKISSAQSVTTTYGYNSGNKYVLQSTTIDPAGLNLSSQYAFDTVGNVTTVTDPRGNATNYTWDGARRLVFEIRPDPDGGGPLLRPATRRIYDLDGDLVELDRGTTTSPIGADFENASPTETTTWTYDSVGHMTEETNQAAVIQYSWDADDRAVCEATRMNPSVYSALPSDACALSAPGVYGSDRIEKDVYDAAGEPTQKIKAEGVQGGAGQYVYATYTYTGNGKQQSVTDANGNKTTMVYDGFDRLIQQQYPVTGLAQGQSDATDYEAYTYDNNDNRLTIRRRDGAIISFCYDALNRQTQEYLHTITSCASPPTLSGSDIARTYDLLDRRLTSDFAGGVGVSSTWDNAGRELTESTNGRTLTFSYDPSGNRSTIQWPDGYFAGYVYDADNRLISLCERLSGTGCASATTLSQGLLATFSYDSLGREIGVTRTNGTSTTRSFDAADRLTSLNLVYGQTANNESWTFGYDPESKVVSQTASNDAYNWTAFPVALSARAFDGLNRDAGIAAIGSQPCSTASGYDCRGNIANEGTGLRSFTYDSENRLLNVGGSDSLALTYDPVGRLQSTVATSGTTNFLFDGDNLVAEYDGSGNLLRRYVPTGRKDAPLIWYDGSVRRWLHKDRLGSVVAWSDDTGALTATQAYGPNGEPQSWTGSRFGYTGQLMLPEAQIYHYKARAYDPISGRFLQTDPIGYKDDLDLYAYAHDDSANHVDPTGTEIDTAGSDTLISEFEDDVYASMGVKIEVKDDGKGKKEFQQVGERDTTKGNAKAAAIFIAALKDPAQITLIMVSHDPRTVVDSYALNTVDVADLEAIGKKGPDVLAATITHFVDERMFTMKNPLAGYDQRDPFTPAHADAMKAEASVYGAVSRSDAHPAFTDGFNYTATYTYKNAAGATVFSFTYTVVNGDVQ